MRSRLPLVFLLMTASGIAGAQASPVPSPTAGTQPQAADGHYSASNKAEGAAAARLSSLTPQQRQLLEEADQLVTLAQQLQTDVDKTNQYTLSLNTMRRADTIEKLAKTLQKQIEREDR